MIDVLELVKAGYQGTRDRLVTNFKGVLHPPERRMLSSDIVVTTEIIETNRRRPLHSGFEVTKIALEDDRKFLFNDLPGQKRVGEYLPGDVPKPGVKQDEYPGTGGSMLYSPKLPKECIEKLTKRNPRGY